MSRLFIALSLPPAHVLSLNLLITGTSMYSVPVYISCCAVASPVYNAAISIVMPFLHVRLISQLLTNELLLCESNVIVLSLLFIKLLLSIFFSPFYRVLKVQ